jgi:hypothetical protein
VKNQSAGVDVPDDGNFVAIEMELGAFAGTPVGSDLRKFADDQRFDVGMRGFFVVEIGADVTDMRIGEADDLPSIAGIAENFLISGKAGVENDFPAAARDGAGRTAVKDAPVLEREYGRSVLNVRQCILRKTSFVVGLGCGQGTEVVHGPVGKNGAAVDELAGDRPKYTRIVRADAVIAHHKITAARNLGRAIVADVGVLGRNIRFLDFLIVHENGAAANFDSFPRKGDYAFDKGFRVIEGIPENYYVTTIDRLKAIDKFVDEDALLVGEERGHAGAFDFHGLVEEDNDNQGEADGDEEIARPNANFVAQKLMRRSGGRIGRDRW